MSGQAPSVPGSRPASTPPDQEYVDGYADGYGEGLRDALREMLHHASRGHTAGELRMLIEGRLARWREDVELKRRNLLAPPPRAAYASLFRAPARAAPPPAATAPSVIPPVEAGASYLVLEPRPDRALRAFRDAALRYPRLVVVTFHPPALADLPSDRVTILRVGVPGVVGEEALTPDVIAGRIRAQTEEPGGAAVYVDALEVLASGGAVEAMVKFVQWASQQVGKTGSVLVASAGSESFDGRTLSLLRRSFSREL